MYFEKRQGPHPEIAYPSLEVPEWWKNAKLGFFIHWGIYSLPAWANPQTPENMRPEDAYIYHTYAEWYANTMRIPESPTHDYHLEHYGLGCAYEDFAQDWEIRADAVQNLVQQIAQAGGKYLIPVTKHHDGFCLWDTQTTPFNATKRGPKRDLIAEFAEHSRKHQLRLGLYFSGALDWHVSDYPPIMSDRDLFTLRRNDPEFSHYAATQVKELIEKYQPDILWNDIEWPDGGKNTGDDSLQNLLMHYLSAVPDGTINDRWGIPAHGFLTREYLNVPEVMAEPWEATRGLGRSFGYNRAEDARHHLTANQLIRQLVDVVSKNGNLLINIGPKADGTIPELQMTPLKRLGGWLKNWGGAIYNTVPWLPAGANPEELAGAADARFVARADGTLIHAICLRPQAGRLELPAALQNLPYTWQNIPENYDPSEVEFGDSANASGIGFGDSANASGIGFRNSTNTSSIRIPDSSDGAPLIATFKTV